MYRFPIGTPVSGRTILAHLESGSRPALNKYLVSYDCCGRETTIQEQSLIKVARENDGQPALCPSCRRKRNKEGLKPPKETLPDSPPIFATWPAPPGTTHRP